MFRFFVAVVVVQGAHLIEHIIQLLQVEVFGVPEDDAFGLLGYVMEAIVLGSHLFKSLDEAGRKDALHSAFVMRFSEQRVFRSYVSRTAPFAKISTV